MAPRFCALCQTAKAAENRPTDMSRMFFLRFRDRGALYYHGSRDTQTVKRNQQQHNMPLKILSYDELYGWTMDAIVAKIGKKNNCTFCGVFRRQALDRGAAMLNVNHIV